MFSKFFKATLGILCAWLLFVGIIVLVVGIFTGFH